MNEEMRRIMEREAEEYKKYRNNYGLDYEAGFTRAWELAEERHQMVYIMYIGRSIYLFRSIEDTNIFIKSLKLTGSSSMPEIITTGFVSVEKFKNE